MIRVLLTTLALSFGSVFAQDAENPFTAALDLPSSVTEEVEESPLFSLLDGGQIYCKLTLDAHTSSLCFVEYNLVEVGPFRFGVAAEGRILPDVQATPLFLLDVTEETWFAGAEFGASLLRSEGVRLGLYFGMPLP